MSQNRIGHLLRDHADSDYNQFTAPSKHTEKGVSIKIQPKTNENCSDDFLSWTESQVEAYLVEAAWTLRKLPDPEVGYLKVKTMIWEGVEAESRSIYVPKNRLVSRKDLPSPKEIDRFMDILGWLEMVPEKLDRKILFWAAWHMHGVARRTTREKIKWKNVVKSMYPLSLSRYQLWRRHRHGLSLIAAVLTQRQFNFT